MPRPSFETVDAYIAAMPRETQAALKQVRATLRKALPKATEGISYQIPVYKVDGAMVLYFAGYRHHFAIYPATESLIAALGDALAGALKHKATIRFPLPGEVPVKLITRIAKLRAAEVAALEAAKAAKKKPAKKKAAKRKAPSRKAARSSRRT